MITAKEGKINTIKTAREAWAVLRGTHMVWSQNYARQTRASGHENLAVIEEAVRLRIPPHELPLDDSSFGLSDAKKWVEARFLFKKNENDFRWLVLEAASRKDRPDIWSESWHCPYCGAKIEPSETIASDEEAFLKCQTCGCHTQVKLLNPQEVM